MKNKSKLSHEKIFTETYTKYPIKDDVVTCRINFRRRPFVV